MVWPTTWYSPVAATRQHDPSFSSGSTPGQDNTRANPPPLSRCKAFTAVAVHAPLADWKSLALKISRPSPRRAAPRNATPM